MNLLFAGSDQDDLGSSQKDARHPNTVNCLKGRARSRYLHMELKKLRIPPTRQQIPAAYRIFILFGRTTPAPKRSNDAGFDRSKSSQAGLL